MRSTIITFLAISILVFSVQPGAGRKLAQSVSSATEVHGSGSFEGGAYAQGVSTKYYVGGSSGTSVSSSGGGGGSSSANVRASQYN